MLHPAFQSHLAAVAVPVVHGSAVVHIVIHRLSQGPEHHILMVSQDPAGVGHGHDFPQDPDAAGMPVHHIPQDKEGIRRLQLNLVQNGPKTALMAVDIGHHINHGNSLLSPMVDGFSPLVNKKPPLCPAAEGRLVLRR